MISSTARDAIGGAAPWIERLARVGYASRGVIYIIIGGLAVALARQTGGATTDSRGALGRIAEQPLGSVALVVIAAGLAGYAVWRLIEAVMNPEHLPNDPKGIIKRVGYAGRGLIYVGLAIAAFRMASGRSSGGGSGGADDWTARVMSLPAGRWLVGLAAVLLIAYGIHRIIRAWRADIGKHMRIGEMTDDTSHQVIHVSRFGIAARGVVFVLVGWLLVQAALHLNPSEAGGVGEALDSLARQPFGRWLLGIVALGLVAFGVHSLLEAKYRRIDVA